MFEEIDGAEYDVIKARQGDSNTESASKPVEEVKPKKKKTKNKNDKSSDEKPAKPETPEITPDVRKAWSTLCIPECLLPGVAKFSAPTPIQLQAIPAAIRDKSDIIGGAQTGSGKTLAFGLPLMARLFEAKPTQVTDFKSSEFDKFQLSANGNEFLPSLIILPTRELAKQVATQLN